VLQTETVVKIKTHILFSITFFENLAVYEILWKNFTEPDKPQTTTWRMHDACWRPNATKQNRQYLLLFHSKNVKE
jgi:hypothetical protein